MNTAYLLIGGNLGDRVSNLAGALALISERAGQPFAISALYETAAWGLSNQPDFLNQAIAITTNLTASQLLETILDIEAEMGRQRNEKYGPRLLDIDIIFFNSDIIDMASLTVPHPHLQNRRFVLVPLAEIAPHLIHPVLQTTIQQLLNDCPDPLDVKKFCPAKAANQVDL